MPSENDRETIPAGLKLLCTFSGHEQPIFRLAWSPGRKWLASPSMDASIHLWDVETRAHVNTLKGHLFGVNQVSWSPDGQKLASASFDRSCRIWDVQTEEQIHILPSHTFNVTSVAWAPNGQILASGSDDATINLWEVERGRLRRTLQGHRAGVKAVKWLPDSRTVVSAADDGTIRLWDAETGQVLSILEEATTIIHSLACSPDGRWLATAPAGRVVHIWDIETQRQIAILEGHTDDCSCVAFSHDGLLLASKSLDHTVRLWRCDTWTPVAVLHEESSLNPFTSLDFHPQLPLLATLGRRDTAIRIWSLDMRELLGAVPDDGSFQYLNAKVVLLGEGGVGKSGLGIRIAERRFRPTEATHGGQFWQIPVPRHVTQRAGLTNVQAELILWDFAGQRDYRLVHQLFLDDTHVALLLFNCSDLDDPFRGVSYWAKVLKKQAPQSVIKFLVSARTDISPISVDQNRIAEMLEQYGLHAHHPTCARDGTGVEELVEQMVEAIPWNTLPRTTRPRLFQIIQTYLLERKRAGDAFVSLDEIPQAISSRYTGQAPSPEDIATVIDLLQRGGLVYRLDSPTTASRILLQPELLNQYAASIIQGARNHSRGIGAISESDLLRAQFPLSGFQRLEARDERIVLEAAIEAFITHDLAFREMGMLVFPSQINISRPAPTWDHPPTEVTYRFSGGVEAIYASLVVRLSYTDYFQREDMWKYTIQFSRHGHLLGFTMREEEEGTCELDIYFSPDVSEFDRVTFIRFITDHLHTKGIDIQEHILLFCPNCKREVKDREAIAERVRERQLDIYCQYCVTRVLIPSSIEEHYRSDTSYHQKQQELVEKVDKRTVREVQDFRSDITFYSQETDHRIRILHLSDIHIKTMAQAQLYRAQLVADLDRELQVKRLDYLVISGDITDQSTQEEYAAAYDLVDSLVKRFGLDANRLVIVPGNHDLNWDSSERAYPFIPKRKVPEKLSEGSYIPGGETGTLVRDEDLYRRRFAYFSDFYKKVFGDTEYPLDYMDQAILLKRPNDRILFLALNSCWEIDHYYRRRASINMQALAKTLEQLGSDYDENWVKIAVWHHPVTGREAMRDDFLELLAVHGFQLCMHGHIHEAIEAFHKYDNQRGIHIIGAGTFGAPAKEQVLGIPLQYNLILFNPNDGTVTVETRKKEKPDGAWSADARWGNKNNPEPRRHFVLRQQVKNVSKYL